MDIRNSSDFNCEQCGQAYNDRWKKLGPTLYACNRCGQARTILLYDEQDQESLRQIELDSLIGRNVIPNLDDLNFKAAEMFLRGLREDYPNSPKVYFYSALADNAICYTQDDIDPEKYIPTLNDIRGTTIFKNPNVIKCLELAIGDEKQHYQDTFDYIEKKRNEIKNEFTKGTYHYDVFISCKVTEVDPATKGPILDGRGKPLKTREAELAHEVCRLLWKSGVENVFYSEVEKDKMAGKRFENVIFSALHQAKVLILVANKREYIDWRWVRNEWKRFLNVMDEAQDGVQRKLIVYTEELAVNELPRELQRYQIVNRKDVGADHALFAAVQDAVKSSIVYSGTKVTASKIEAKKVETVAIVKGEKFDHQIDLSSSEETDFEIAQADIATDDKKHYKAALKRLISLSNSNKTNFKVNWAMVLCIFEAKTENVLKKRDLSFLKGNDIARFNEYLTNALGSADVYQLRDIFPILKGIFINTITNGNIRLLYTLCTGKQGESFDVYSTFIGFLKQDQMTTLADGIVEAIAGTINKEKLPYSIAELDALLKAIAVRVYSNDEKALEKLLGCYQKLAAAFLLARHFDYCQGMFNSMLSFDAYNAFALWGRFMASIQCDDPFLLPTKLKQENWVNYDITKEDAPERKPNNLYSTIVDILKGGYEITNANGNYFSICVNTAREALILKRDKIALPMYKALIDLTVGQFNEHRVTADYARGLCLAAGDILCITEHFPEAKECFSIVVGNEELSCHEAYWGLTKADLEIKTNFGAYLYKGRLVDNQFFKVATDRAAKMGDKSYTKFYALIEEYKSNRKKAGAAKRAFDFSEKKDIAEGKSTPIKNILKIFASEATTKNFLYTQVKQAETAKKQPKAARGEKPSKKIFAHSCLILLTLASVLIYYLFATHTFLYINVPISNHAFAFPTAPVVAILLLVPLRLLFGPKSKLADYGSPYSRAVFIFLNIIGIAFMAFTIIFRDRVYYNAMAKGYFASLYGWSEEVTNAYGLYSIAVPSMVGGVLSIGLIINMFSRHVTYRKIARPYFYMALVMLLLNTMRYTDFSTDLTDANLIVSFLTSETTIGSYLTVIAIGFGLIPAFKTRKSPK